MKEFITIIIILSCFVGLSCDEKENVHNTKNIAQNPSEQAKENIREIPKERENQQNKDQNNQQSLNQNTQNYSQNNQIDNQEIKDKKSLRTINIFFDDDGLTEKEQYEFRDILLNAIGIISSNKEDLAKLYKERQMQFIITSDIKRVAGKSHAPLPVVPGIIGVDSFSFGVKSKDDGSVEYFTVLDEEVFASFSKLMVAVNHESIHMKHYVFGGAKEQYLDEEIQTYAENLDDLEDLNKSLDLEKKLPETGKQLKELTLKERGALQTYQKAKLLRQLRQSK